MKSPKLIIGAVALVGAFTLSACSGADPMAADGSDNAGSSDGSITIGSADFSESQLLATIYSQALQAGGIEVTERFNIGSREVYIAAVQDGSIDLVPDYSGALLKYLDPEAKATTSEDVDAALAETLPDDLTSYEASDAQNKDVLTVTQETAAKHNLTSISDVEPVAGDLVLGGPPEWVDRVNGVVGLRDVYGLEFKEFLPLDAGGPLTLSSLTSGQIQVADMFSTDPALTEQNLVALEDDKALFAAENILPVINTSKATPEVEEILNAVSAALTTEDLIAMNAKATAGEPLTDIAGAWLTEAGLN